MFFVFKMMKNGDAQDRDLRVYRVKER